MPQNYADLLFGPPAQGGLVPTQPGNYADLLFGEGGGVPPAQEESLLTPITTAVGSALAFVNRPSRAVAEAALALQKGEEVLPGVKRALAGDSQVSFEDVLAARGMEEGMGRTLAGFGLDVATDPLNLVGGLPFKGTKALASLGPVQKAGRAIKELPIVEDLGRKFVPHFGLPTEYANKRRLLDSEIGYRKASAFEEAIKRYKGVSPAEAKTLTKSLDKPAAPLGDEKLDRLAGEQRKAFSEQAQKEVAAGVLPAEKLKDDYVTYLFGGELGGSARASLGRKLSAKNPFAKQRDLVSIEQALFLGAEPHIAKIAAVRKATGDRAIAVADFFKKTADDFGVAAEGAPAGYRGVNIAADMPIKEVFKGKAFEPAIAEDLEKLFKPGEARGAIDEAFRVATGVWKGYATAANPGFHIRNLASNVFNSWLGGMSLAKAPIRYEEAAAWGLGRAKAIGKYSAAEVDGAMKRFGVVGSGHGAFGEVSIELDRLASATKGKVGKAVEAVNPASMFNAYQAGGRAIGQRVEDLSRQALFIDQLHKGKSLEEAALHVKKYLFDYAELTDAERRIRDYGVPFYTWIRKNFPLQVESLVSQPQKYAHVAKAVSEIEEAGDDDIPQGERPEWLQKNDAVQLPTKTSTGENVFFSPDLPFQDLNLIPADALSKGEPAQGFSDFISSVVSSANPLVKIPAELAMNREAYTGREIVNPDVGPEQLVRAPAYLGALASLSPSLASSLGMRKSLSRQGEEQWVMPARGAYLANQVPFFTKLGKVFATTESEQQGELVGPFQPRQLSYFGFGLTPFSEEQRAQNLAARMREQTTQTRRLNRQEALTLPTDPSELEAYLLRLALGQ